MRLGLVILSLSVVILASQTIQSEAAKFDSIGIDIEKSCLLSTKCVKYKDITYLDTSPKTIGEFKQKGDDIRRSYTPKQDNPQWLVFYGPAIVVDPPSKIAKYSKMIHIVSSLDEYHDISLMNVRENQTRDDAKPTHSVRTTYHTRHVNENCSTAIITAKNWQKLLPDTLNYMQHNCDEWYTKINTIHNDVKPLTKHTISTTADYKLKQYYKIVFDNCLKSRNACQSLDNRAITTMGDSK